MNAGEMQLSKAHALSAQARGMIPRPGKKTKQNKKNQKPTKKPNHLYLLLGRSLKEFDEKDMFRSCDLV